MGGLVRKSNIFDRAEARRGSIDDRAKSDASNVGTSEEASAYIRVLESTINQLRTEVNTMNFKSRSSKLKRELRPLDFYRKPERKKEDKNVDRSKQDLTVQFERQLTKITKDLNMIWGQEVR